MKIAQISPLIESVPPQYYGGTERVVSFLTEELVRQGHDVSLFASADSITSATLVPCSPKALRLDQDVSDALPHYTVMLEEVRRRARSFDILHFHFDYVHYPLLREMGLVQRSVTTLHGRLDLKDLAPVFREFGDMPLVSISAAQRIDIDANWLATVHHGLPRDLYALDAGAGGYVAFLGRISPEKRPDRAVDAAGRAGMALRIAAKVDDADREYFEKVIRPLLGAPHVQFVGEIGEGEKQGFLGGATALLFLIDWPEPFGLVMIEAMACGTPVVAWRCGSVPEVIDNGVTGFIVDSREEAVAALSRTKTLDRRLVRQRFEERFTAERMARDYLEVYRTLIGDAQAPEASLAPALVSVHGMESGGSQ